MPVGEAQITRLNRERLEAIKKFLPVRDAFRDNLQRQQQQRDEFKIGSAELFKPITTATEKVVTATEKVATAIEESKPKPITTPKKTYSVKLQELRNRFNEGFLAYVDKTPLIDLINIAARGYYEKEKYLKPGQFKYIKNEEDFIKNVYKLKNDLVEIRNSEPTYRRYLNLVEDEYNALNDAGEVLMTETQRLREQRKQRKQQELLKQQKKKYTSRKSKRQEDPIIEDPVTETISEEQTKEPDAFDLLFGESQTGKGYHGGNIPCSRSIVDDISRLEVLIGGKRAGNNSPEIINEATEICKRLFQGRIMDIGMYRSFINELIDDYYSD
ncbi:hypothetical protein ACJMK2_037325 [Sinanodonta woodiana]|uniref:Uncharacterized protein n=1 Tax=Sinanodonta woodiana TaxID=1069815 RepID=A0ABD3WLT3_SINWO